MLPFLASDDSEEPSEGVHPNFLLLLAHFGEREDVLDAAEIYIFLISAGWVHSLRTLAGS